MSGQNTAIQTKRTINCRGKLIDISTPKVMGIINLTPDSFYDGGKLTNRDAILKLAEKQLKEGATFLDLGAVSTRPKAEMVPEDEERKRLLSAVEALRKAFPETIISVDTFRAKIAEEAVASGADIINDISGGELDQAMFETIAKLRVPYILMHMQGTPETMQQNPTYADVTREVIQFMMDRVLRLQALGVHDIIIDPGFGFGKSVDHNFQLLRKLNQFSILGHPLLVGLSRKSMINKVLRIAPENALNGTTALHMAALERGAKVLRVHDVQAAVECVKLSLQLKEA